MAIAVAMPFLLLAGAALVHFQQSAAASSLRAQMPEIAAAAANYLRTNGSPATGEAIELALKRNREGVLIASAPEGGGAPRITIGNSENHGTYCDISIANCRRRFLLAPDFQNAILN
ncbi:MAG: hypothetical protein LBB38_00825 [Puniceicoccales bacterium]|nr:hypothetical protein [Puniceicoccales bacterium]